MVSFDIFLRYLTENMLDDSVFHKHEDLWDYFCNKNGSIAVYNVIFILSHVYYFFYIFSFENYYSYNMHEI
jgi:hypothetical protein